MKESPIMKKPAAVLAVLSLAVLALALVPAVGLAAKGGNGGGGHGGGKPTGGGSTGSASISLAYPLVYDANGNGAPNWRDTVSFNVSTTATTEPYVDLQCFQNGVLVAEGWRGYFDGSLDTRNFGLYGGQWTGGAADCTAYVDMSTSRGMQQLGSTTFHVDA
jgi:hypothetical protein